MLSKCCFQKKYQLKFVEFVSISFYPSPLLRITRSALMKKLCIFLVFFLSGLVTTGQSIYWKKSKQDFSSNRLTGGKSQEYQVFELDQKALLRDLSSSKSTEISIPNSKGEFEKFLVVEKGSASKKLAEKYPSIKTFRGYKIADPKTRIALTLTDDRLFITTFSEAAEAVQMLAKDTYLFYKQNETQIMSEQISCGVSAPNQADPANILTSTNSRLNVTSQTAKNKTEGTRTLRLAVVASGEYAEINGGTKTEVLANIISIVNAANSISELDLGILYELIDTNDKLIFVDKTTDPYNIEEFGISTNSSYLNTRTQIVIDSLIGKENYDLGHLFIARNETESQVPYGIGNAYGIGNVGTPEKGSGWSYWSKSTSNQLGFVGLVSHEFGHHLGATHTFSNLADGLITQSELSSGRSIMSYGRINQSDLHYYHYHSIHQIIESFKRTQYGIKFSEIGSFTPFTQQPPGNVSLKAYHIPIKTPFILNTPAELASEGYFYNWEQLDSELVLPGSYWGSKSLKAPLFSSTSPGSAAKRFFPAYARVLTNNLTEGDSVLTANAGTSQLFETLTEVPRAMTFGLSVRDGALLQGVYLDSTQVTTVSNSKPFSILTPLTTPLTAGNPLTLEWEISNTNDDPIKATQVNILLSKDGGNTFNYLLAEKTANDGSQKVLIPNVTTATARLKIEPLNHIFYTINPKDFGISGVPFSLFSSALELELTNCNDYGQTFNLEVQSNQQITDLANISFTGAPQGLTLVFSKNQASVNQLFTATISNQSAPSGTYNITLKAEINGTLIERALVVNILSDALIPVTLSSPTAGAVIDQNAVELKWEKAGNIPQVLLQISKNQNFDSLLIDKISFGDRYVFSPLENGATYYWRVFAGNGCATSESVGSSFRVSKGFEKKLTHNPAFFDTSTGIYPIQVTDSSSIKEVKLLVSVAKDFSTQNIKMNNMTLSLINPSGLAVLLANPAYENTVVNLSSISYLFEDQAPDYSAPIFNDSTQIWQLQVKSLEPLAQFIGGKTLGNWNLKVEGKPEELRIEGVAIAFLSDQEFKAPKVENRRVYLFSNESKISFTGKNYLEETLDGFKLIINQLPTNGTLVDAENRLLEINQGYLLSEINFVPNQDFQGLDGFNYQLVDTDFNLKSTTARVIIDYKEIKPDFKIFDTYASVKVGDSQTLNLTLKNAEFYDSYTLNLSSPQYGTAEINGNTLVYQATNAGDELLEVSYTVGEVEAKSYIHITNFTGYNAIEEPSQVLNREDFGFRIGRTVAINADGSILASSQNISWDEASEEFNKNYEGLIKVFSLQDGKYTPLGDEIRGQGINDRLGYRISLSGDGKRLAAVTNHVEGCITCQVSVDYVVVYAYNEGNTTWELLGEKILFDGQGAGAGGVDIQSVDLNFDGTILAVGNAREPNNGNASGAVFTFSFSEVSKGWVQKGSLITTTYVGKPDYFTDFGAFVRLNKAGNRLVLNQPYSFFNFNASKAGNVFAFEFVDGDWSLMGKPISGSQGFWTQFGKTVDINDLGDIIVVSENYEVLSGDEIYLGKAHAYQYDAVTSNWKALGNQMKGPKITIAEPIEEWRFTEENAKVSINGTGNQIALSLKVTENFEENYLSPQHFISVFNYEKDSSDWTSFSEPFAREVHEEVHRPTYDETILSNKGTKVFFGSGHKLGLSDDKTFIKVYETIAPPDRLAPTLVLKSSYTLQIPASGTAVLETSMVDNGSTDNVGITRMTLSKTSFSCADLGVNKVIFTAEDAAGNTSSAEVTVTVVDEIKPTLKVKNVFIIKLDAEGKATLKWEDIDEGSTDNCSIKERTLSKTEFSRNDSGDNKITYTLIDVSGNTSSIELIIQVDIVLSVPERPKEDNSIKAYPNPVKDYLYLKFTEGLSISAIRASSLVDTSGRVIGEIRLEEGSGGQLGFSTQELRSGIYFLRLSTRDTLHLIKFIVIH